MNSDICVDSNNASDDFVDRLDELEYLEGKMERVLDSEGQVVLLKGEAGIGKSYMAEAFLKQCSKHGFEVLKGRCPYHGSTDPFVPFIEAMGEYLDDKTMEDRSGRGFGVAVGMIPMGEEEESADISISDKRELMFDKLAKVIIRRSKERPIILFIDDLQWIDEASAQLLHYLARHTSDDRVLLHGAYRPEELCIAESDSPLVKVLDRMKEEKLVDVVDVERFDPEAATELISKKLNAEDLPESFLSMIYKTTEGNPYYIIETLNSMVEEEIIDPYSYRWDPKSELAEISIPESIKDITLRRIDKLSKSEKNVLMFASVIGTKFDFEVLEISMDMDVMELLDIVDNMRALGLIQEIEDDENEIYRFGHIQTRKTIYENIGKSRKRVLHDRVGKAIEKVYKGKLEEHYYPLSRHFYEANDHKKSYEFSMKAGQKAMSSYAIESAIEFFDRALISIKKARDIECVEEKEEELLNILGDLRYDTSDWDKAIETFEMLRERGRELEDKMMEECSLRKIGHVYCDIQNFDRAKEYFEKAIEISQELGYDEGIADANRGIGSIHWRAGRFEKAIEHYELTIEKAKNVKNKRILAYTYIEMGNVYSTMGNNGLAIQYYKLSLPTLNRYKAYKELARAYNNIGDGYLKMGDWDKAIEFFDNCAKNAEMISNKRAIAWSYFNRAEALAFRGDTKEAMEYAQRAEKILDRLKDNIGLSSVYRVIGISNRLEGDLKSALENSERAMEIIEGLDVPVIESDTRYTIGRVHEDMGDLDTAKDYYIQAKSILEDIGEGQLLGKVKQRLENLDM